MPLATITEIRDGLVANLQTALGDQIQALRSPVGNPTPPTAWVLRDRTDFDVTLQRGTDMHVFLVQLLVGLVDGLDSQDLLDQYAAPAGGLSVKAAIESDTTLGGLVDDLRVTEVARDQVHLIYGQAASAQYLGTEFTVEVYA
jgi:hypothetical protein